MIVRRLAVAFVALFGGLAQALADPPPFARDQLFFVGDDGAPTRLAVILQTGRGPRGIALEAKTFLIWRGQWRPAFWERVGLDAWPEDELGAVIEAWLGARAAGGVAVAPARVSWASTARGFELSVRRPAGGLSLRATSLSPVGSGPDPHGEVEWSAGPGTLRVNGVEVSGQVIVEHLARPRTAWPQFGRFEMWLYGDGLGGALLGRVDLAAPSRVTDSTDSSAVWVPPEGPPRRSAFTVSVLDEEVVEETGLSLPVRWSASVDGDAFTLVRASGERAVGFAPDGGFATYDISLAPAASIPSQHRGRGAALVFHLQDVSAICDQ